MSTLRKLADDLSEASAALAAWQPETMSDALSVIPVLPDLTRDLTYMWERMADHLEDSRHVCEAVTGGVRDIAAYSATQELEADALLNQFPKAAGYG
jgi:hypothetical protein